LPELPVPAGWEQYNYPQDGIKRYMPKTPSQSSTPVGCVSAGSGAPFCLGGWTPSAAGTDTRDAEALSGYSPATGTTGFTSTGSSSGTAQGAVGGADQFRRDRRPVGRVSRRVSVRWIGSDAMEQTPAIFVVLGVPPRRTDRVGLMP